MSEDEMLEQLYDLIEDRKTFLCDDPSCVMYEKDILALEMIIDKYEKVIKYLESRIIQLKHHKSKSYSNKLRIEECKLMLEKICD